MKPIDLSMSAGPEAVVTGRNGTFQAKYLNVYSDDEHVQLTASGRRGITFNAGFFGVDADEFANLCRRYLAKRGGVVLDLEIDEPEAKGHVVIRQGAYGLAIEVNGLRVGLLDLFALAKDPEHGDVRFNFSQEMTGATIEYARDGQLEVHIDDGPYTEWKQEIDQLVIAINEPEEETA